MEVVSRMMGMRRWVKGVDSSLVAAAPDALEVVVAGARGSKLKLG